MKGESSKKRCHLNLVLLCKVNKKFMLYFRQFSPLPHDLHQIKLQAYCDNQYSTARLYCSSNVHCVKLMTA